MLRDHLVCGINDQVIRRKMLTEKKLTLKLALEIAESTQAAAEIYIEMSAVKVKEEPVNKVNDRTDKRTYYRCGTPGHLADKCRHKDTFCRSCNKRRHLARACRSKSKEHIPSRGSSNPRTPRKPRKHQGVRHAKAEYETDEEYENVGRIRGVKSKTPPIQVPER